MYADDSTIGWISNTTIQLFPNGGLFAYLDNNINNSKTGSGCFLTIVNVMTGFII